MQPHTILNDHDEGQGTILAVYDDARLAFGFNKVLTIVERQLGALYVDRPPCSEGPKRAESCWSVCRLGREGQRRKRTLRLKQTVAPQSTRPADAHANPS